MKKSFSTLFATLLVLTGPSLAAVPAIPPTPVSKATIAAAGGSLKVLDQAQRILTRAPLQTDDASKGYNASDVWRANVNGVPMVWAAKSTVAGQATWLRSYGAEALPLDAVTAVSNGTLPVAAYATIKLRAAYTGNFANIVRASDGTNTDVPYSANGLASVSTISNFCAGTYCYYRTLYDNSGNGNNATTSQTSVGFTGSETSAGVVTVTAVAYGTIVPGMVIRDPTYLTNTASTHTQTITSQLTGTTGGVGTYQASATGFTIASTGWTGVAGVATWTASISGTAMTVTGTPTGTLAPGMRINVGAAQNTIITAGSGTSWTVSQSQTVASTSMSGSLYAPSAIVDIVNGVPVITWDTFPWQFASGAATDKNEGFAFPSAMAAGNNQATSAFWVGSIWSNQRMSGIYSVGIDPADKSYSMWQSGFSTQSIPAYLVSGQGGGLNSQGLHTKINLAVYGHNASGSYNRVFSGQRHGDLYRTWQHQYLCRRLPWCRPGADGRLGGLSAQGGHGRICRL